MLVRSFHASTLSLVLIHAAGITKQHTFALLQQAFEQLVREEYELDTRYAVCANVLSNFVFSDTVHGARVLNTNYVFSEGELISYLCTDSVSCSRLLRHYSTSGSRQRSGTSVGLLLLWLLGACWDRFLSRKWAHVFFAIGVSRTCAPSGFSDYHTVNILFCYCVSPGGDGGGRGG